MAEFDYGPAEIIVAQFDGDRPSAGIVEAILDLVASGTVRLLDLLFITRSTDGTIEVMELAEVGDEIGMTDVVLEAGGLAGDEDVDEVGALIEPGRGGAVLVIEHLWAKTLASRLFEAGGMVVHTERIPAPVVNAIVAGGYEEDAPAGALE